MIILNSTGEIAFNSCDFSYAYIEMDKECYTTYLVIILKNKEKLWFEESPGCVPSAVEELTTVMKNIADYINLAILETG